MSTELFRRPLVVAIKGIFFPCSSRRPASNHVLEDSEKSFKAGHSGRRTYTVKAGIRAACNDTKGPRKMVHRMYYSNKVTKENRQPEVTDVEGMTANV